MGSFTIITGKEGAQPKKPLFLVTIIAPDGDACYLGTPTYYGQEYITYNGVQYSARIQRNEIDAIQSMSPQGYDSVPGFQLTLADADKFIWTNHCFQHGWRGSNVTLTIVLWDVVANQYSTDSLQYTFIGGNPAHNHAAGTTTLDVTSATNFTRIRVPSTPISFRCINTFPASLLQRIGALNDPTNISYGCGYSADCGGVGNLIARTTITSSIAATGNPVTFTVASASGFPATPFQATIDVEELLIINASGTSLTALRARHGTTMGPHSSGATFNVPFSDCDLTRSSPSDPSVGCMARLGDRSRTSIAPDGDLTQDLATHYTARFAGITWLAPTQYSGRQYTTGQKVFGFNQPNTAIAGMYFNWVYGTQWVNAPPLAPGGDPNSLRWESVPCFALYGPANVIQVVANGVIVPQGNSDQLFTWRYITQGGRSGALNGDAIFDKHGDPHGSQCCIEVVVPAELAAPGSVPSCQVLITGDPVIQVYPITSISSGVVTFTGANTSCAGNPPFTVRIVGNSNPSLNGDFTLTNWTFGPPGTVTLSGTSASGTGGSLWFFAKPDLWDTGGSIVTNPTGNFNNIAGPACNLVWAVLDLMTWGNITLEQIDAVSWYNAAQIAATQISYTAADGSTQTHAQFKASFVLSGEQRQTLSQVLTALRNAGNLMVGPNTSTGLIQCFVRQTLADQQPNPVPGSNYNTAVSSIHADLTAASGYYAYYFDETVIEKDSFRVTTTRIESTPNTVSVSFQDEYNGYVQDSMTEIDPVAYLYSGNQENQVPIPIMGAPNFDQLTRVANVQLAEALYGNPRNDPGGTLYFEFMVNQRVIHLVSRLGFICGLTWQSLGIGVSAPQPVRILSLKPDTDGEHWQVKAAWHQDIWYTYAYGQNPTPFQQNPLLNPPNRPPYPWQPASNVFSNSVLFSNRSGFIESVSSSQVTLSGAVPVNTQFTVVPAAVPLQASTGNTGGTLSPGNYYISVSSNGAIGPASGVITAVVPSGTSTNKITINNISWPKGTATAPAIFIGTTPMNMLYQGLPTDTGALYSFSNLDSFGNPGTITITGLSNIGRTGLPDVVFSKFLIRETPIVHGGVWGDQITSTDNAFSPTLTFANANWSANQWAGYVLSLYYRPGGTFGHNPALDSTVTSSTTNTLTLSSGAFHAGDVVVLRAKASSISSNTIGDPNFVNSYNNNTGLTVNAEAGNLIWIIAGTGAGQAPKTIASNTSTVLTITGTWDTTPDATSIFIVTSPSPVNEILSKPITNDGTGSLFGTIGVIPLPSSAQSMLIQVATADVNGNGFPMQYQPFREIWMPPASGSANAYFTITPSGGFAKVDLANGNEQRLVLNSSAVTLAAPIYAKGSLADGMSLTLHLDQDATGGRAVPAFTGGSGGFASDAASKVGSAFDQTANTSTIVQFVRRNGVWVMKAVPITGVALS